jgi:DNA gyrase subunit A
VAKVEMENVVEVEIEEAVLQQSELTPDDALQPDTMIDPEKTEEV